MSWIDLSPFDVTESDLVARAVARASADLPSWSPKEGQQEMVLLEAMAGEAVQTAYAVHRLAIALFRGVLRLLGVTISSGQPPTATATFTAFDTAGHTIPAGTVLRYRSTDYAPVEMLFATAAEVTISPGASTITVEVVGQSNSPAVNGAPVGATLDMASPMSWVRSVAFATTPAEGEWPETEIDYLSRGADALARLSDTLVLPAHLQTAAEAWPGVRRSVAVNAAQPGEDEGTSPGHVTVYVLAAGGSFVSDDTMAALEAGLNAATRADLVVHVTNMSVTTVPVTATVRRYPDEVTPDVQAACQTALAAYLDGDTWTPGVDVEVNELIEVLGRDAPGVDVVVSIAAPAATVVIPARGVAKLGAATITVNAP